MKVRALSGPLVTSALVLSTWMAHWRLLDLRGSAPKEAREALSGVLTPGEMAGVTLLGGFRSIAVDIIWIRLTEGIEEQRFEELPLAFSALEVLQSDSPFLYRLEADLEVLDIPRFLAHRSEERWTWVRRGLEALERGIRRFPGNLVLLREAEYLYYLRFHPHRSPGDRARFLSERPRPGEAVEYGQDPIQIARKAGERAIAEPGHPFDVDALLWAIYRLAYGLALEEAKPEGRDLLSAAERLLEHVEKSHGTVPEAAEFLRSWRKQLEEGLRSEGDSRP